MNEVQEYLESTAIIVAQNLIDMYARIAKPNVGLIFPRKRDGKIRISEQESKVLFAHRFIADQRFCFSVETPTAEKYRQTGMSDMSARVDLTLAKSDGSRLAHIELKGPQYTLESVRKDLEKLVREDTLGLWFHTLTSDLTGIFCTSGSEREFTLEGSWYADQEIQAGADRDAAAAG